MNRRRNNNGGYDYAYTTSSEDDIEEGSVDPSGFAWLDMQPLYKIGQMVKYKIEYVHEPTGIVLSKVIPTFVCGISAHTSNYISGYRYQLCLQMPDYNKDFRLGEAKVIDAVFESDLVDWDRLELS